MADQHPGEQPLDVSAEPGRPPVTEDTRVTSRPATSRLVSPSAHRWPGGIDEEVPAAPPDDATRPALEPAAEAAVETEPAPAVEAEPAVEVEPAVEAEPAVEMEPATDVPAPARSRLRRAWSAVPRPLKLGAIAAWLVLLVAPVLLTHVADAPLHLPGSTATPPALTIQEEVAATTPSSRAAAAASPAGVARPGPTVRPGSTPAPGSTAAPAPGTTPSLAPTAVPTPPSPPPTPVPTMVTTPVDTCGAPQNPWGYNFCGGNLVTSPPPAFCSVFNCVPHFADHDKVDYVAECQDGTYADQTHGPASCIPHGGEMRPLYGP